MQRARHQFLTSAGFSQNANPRVCDRHPFHLGHYLLHRFAGLDDLVLAQALFQLLVFSFQAPQLENVLDREQEFVA